MGDFEAQAGLSLLVLDLKVEERGCESGNVGSLDVENNRGRQQPGTGGGGGDSVLQSRGTKFCQHSECPWKQISPWSLMKDCGPANLLILTS